MCTALLLRLATEIDFAVGPAHLPVLETCIAVIPRQIVLELQAAPVISRFATGVKMAAG